MPEEIQSLTCCCCSSSTKGRQWWDRDAGFGICPDCFKVNGILDVPMGVEVSSFGIRGVHWDIQPEDTKTCNSCGAPASFLGVNRCREQSWCWLHLPYIHLCDVAIIIPPGAEVVHFPALAAAANELEVTYQGTTDMGHSFNDRRTGGNFTLPINTPLYLLGKYTCAINNIRTRRDALRATFPQE